MTTPAKPPFEAASNERASAIGHSLADWLVPTIIFAFSATAAWVATTFDRAPEIIVGDAMQPRVFPIFLMGIIALLNVALIAQMLKTRPRMREPMLWQTWLTATLFLLFYLLTVYIDMFVAMAAVLFILCIALGEKRLWAAACVALIVPLVIFFTFDLLLKVRFPRGLLTNLYYG